MLFSVESDFKPASLLSTLICFILSLSGSIIILVISNLSSVNLSSIVTCAVPCATAVNIPSSTSRIVLSSTLQLYSSDEISSFPNTLKGSPLITTSSTSPTFIVVDFGSALKFLFPTKVYSLYGLLVPLPIVPYVLSPAEYTLPFVLITYVFFSPAPIVNISVPYDVTIVGVVTLVFVPTPNSPFVLVPETYTFSSTV